MTLKTKTLGLGFASLLLVAGCVEPRAFDPNDPNRNTREGAIAGAVAGGLIGAATGDGNRTDDALRGAAIGAVAGGITGNVLDRQARELANSFSNGDIDVINTGDELIVRMPNAILFPVDSANLNAGLRSDLLVLSDSINRYPGTIVSVVGHTDNTGSAAYNQDLSERRAQSVASVLRSGGVSSGRLAVSGAGENRPIATNATAEGRAQNRRVDITITPVN